MQTTGSGQQQMNRQRRRIAVTAWLLGLVALFIFVAFILSGVLGG